MTCTICDTCYASDSGLPACECWCAQCQQQRDTSLVPVTVTEVWLVPRNHLRGDFDNLEWSPTDSTTHQRQFGIASLGVSPNAMKVGADPTLWDWNQ